MSPAVRYIQDRASGRPEKQTPGADRCVSAGRHRSSSSPCPSVPDVDLPRSCGADRSPSEGVERSLCHGRRRAPRTDCARHAAAQHPARSGLRCVDHAVDGHLRELKIVTINRAYAAATLTSVPDVSGSDLFDVFPTIRRHHRRTAPSTSPRRWRRCSEARRPTRWRCSGTTFVIPAPAASWRSPGCRSTSRCATRAGRSSRCSTRPTSCR